MTHQKFLNQNEGEHYVCNVIVNQEFLSYFSIGGGWILSRYYYIDRNYEIRISETKREHFPTFMTAMMIDDLIAKLKLYYSVTVDYHAIGMIAPVESYVPKVVLQSVGKVSDKLDMPEMLLSPVVLMDEDEYFEALQDLVVVRSRESVQETQNLLDYYIYCMQQFVESFDKQIALKSVVVFKRIVVLMNVNPVGLSLLFFDRDYAKLVLGIERLFLADPYRLFPLPCVKDPTIEFPVTMTLEKAFMQCMSWSEANRCRLVCKRWYKAYREMYTAQKAYNIILDQEQDPYKSTVLRASYVDEEIDVCSVSLQDRSCAMCYSIVCECLPLDTFESPVVLVKHFFYDNESVRNYMYHLNDMYDYLINDVLVSQGALFAKRYKIPMTLAASSLLYQLPSIWMYQMRVWETTDFFLMDFTKRSRIKWKGKSYDIFRVYPSLSRYKQKNE